MKFRAFAVPLVALALIPALANGKDKKKTTPAVFNTARYVYVQAEDGDAYDPNILRADREAIANVQDALRKWNRYTLTVDASNAELISYVRKGRVASGRLGGTVGTPGGPGPAGTPGTAGESSPFPGQRRSPGVGTMAEGEAGPPDDFLEVRMQTGGAISNPIWERSQQDGLDAPKVPLIRQLRDAVEKDYPQN